MRNAHRALVLLAPALLTAAIAGCGGQGTTQDTAPTAPPITAESLKTNAADINAGAADMKPPGGVVAPKH